MGGTFQISSFLVESLWALQCLQNTLLLSVSFSSLENNLRQSCLKNSKASVKNSKAIWQKIVRLQIIFNTIRFLGQSSLFCFFKSYANANLRESFWRLTWREHLLVEARGSDKYIKVSKVRDLRWQVRHCTVDLNWPWNSATMMDSFNSLCLLQATSAAVWSSRWSFSSSLYRFRLSAWEQRDKNVGNIILKGPSSFGCMDHIRAKSQLWS